MAEIRIDRDLAGGWRTLLRDPLGILLPAAGILLLQVGVLLVLRQAWGVLDLLALLGLLIGAHALRLVLTSPLRAPLLAAGSRAMDHRTSGLRRAPSLLVVDLVVLALALIAAAILLVPLAMLSTLLLSRGLHLFGALAIAAAVVGAALAALAVRALFAYAPAEAVVGRRNPFSALGRAASRGRGELPQLMVLLLLGDLLVALGGACCGALALPGYPVRELAVLHRWSRLGKEVA